MATEVNVKSIVDEQQLGTFQIAMLVFSFFVLMVDSFDSFSIAYVAPSIIADWQVPRVAFTSVFTANVAGLALGAIVFGMLADRLGNKLVLTAGMATFGVLTLAKAHVGSVEWLAALQFLAAMPIGGAFPIALSIIAENTPLSRRAPLLVIVGFGFMFGATVAGLIAAPVIEHLGWQWMFYLGGVIPIFLSLVALVFVPESLQRLVRRGAARDEVAAALSRIAPTFRYGADVKLVVPPLNPGVPVKELFKEGRALMTSILWIAFIGAFMVYYFLISWLPVLLNAAGMSIGQSLTTGAIYQAGGFTGSLLFAYLSTRRPVPAVTSLLYFMSTLSIIAVGLVDPSLIVPILFLVGVGSIGGINAGNTAVSLVYPAEMRSTGIGWALGVGRLGSMSGPMLGGLMLGLKLPLSTMCFVIAVPAFIGAVAFLLVGRLHAAAQQEIKEGSQSGVEDSTRPLRAAIRP